MPDEGNGDEETGSVLDAMRRFSIKGKSREMKAQMLDDVFVLNDLAILGQWTVFYAAPNTGKTLLTLRMIADAVQSGSINGEKVFYVNADDTYRGAVEKTEIAEEFGFHMIVPGQNGFSTGMLTSMMKSLADAGEAKGVVIVMDTLKKFADLMQKGEQRLFGTQVRSFVSAGGTVVSLAHVNKRRDEAGKLVRQGTSDIQDDCDCTFTLDKVSASDSEESVVIFQNDKARGDVAIEKSFKFRKGKGQGYRAMFNSVAPVGETEQAEAKRQIELQAKAERDREVIDTLLAILNENDEPMLKTELLEKAHKEYGHPRRNVASVFKDWTGKHWLVSSGEANAKQVTPLPDIRSPLPAFDEDLSIA